MPELHYQTLAALADEIERRKVSPLDDTRAILARIERLDPELRAFVSLTPELALQQAERAEQEIGRGEHKGPLHGIPIGIKDLCDTAGVATTAGMTVFSGRVPERNATLVDRLLDAGAVVLGKLTMTEGAGSLHHPSVPCPINPWNPSAWSGASSSGSGVATAAGLCFGSIGTDTAGSIRFPSAANALVGLKPTFGRVPKDGVFPLASSLDHPGPMTRSVRDAALMLQVLAGPSSADPLSAHEAVDDYTKEIELGVKGLRLGLDEAYCTHLDADLGQAVLEAARVLEREGATIRAFTVPDLGPALDAFAKVLHAEAAAAHAAFFDEHRAKYGPHLAGIVEIGRAVSGSDYARAHETRLAFTSELRRRLDTVDALICPPSLSPPPPTEAMRHTPSDFSKLAFALSYTAPYTLAGTPCLTLPCGFTEANVPLAFQLVGAPFSEARLLRVGRAFERATDWHARHPIA